MCNQLPAWQVRGFQFGTWFCLPRGAKMSSRRRQYQMAEENTLQSSWLPVVSRLPSSSQIFFSRFQAFQTTFGEGIMNASAHRRHISRSFAPLRVRKNSTPGAATVVEKVHTEQRSITLSSRRTRRKFSITVVGRSRSRGDKWFVSPDNRLPTSRGEDQSTSTARSRLPPESRLIGTLGPRINDLKNMECLPILTLGINTLY